MHPDVLADMFHGDKGPDKGGCYLYGRHFNPTVYNLSRQLAALEGTESAYCTASGMAMCVSTSCFSKSLDSSRSDASTAWRKSTAATACPLLRAKPFSCPMILPMLALA